MKIQHILLGLLAVAVLGVPSLQASPVLTLTPAGGAISGAPGATIGWGFSLFNPDNNYAVITSADFCVGAPSSPCTTALGVFQDFIAQYNFTYVGPGETLSAVFDPINYTGIGSYTLNANASGSLAGQIIITYDLYADGPGDNLLVTDQRLSANASVTSTAVPEPVSFALLGLGLLSIGWVKRSAAL
jgi:hypothetical protein